MHCFSSIFQVRCQPLDVHYIGISHFWVTVTIWLSTTLLLYYTHRWLMSHTGCSQHWWTSKLNTLHTNGKSEAQRGAVLWNSDPLSFSLPQNLSSYSLMTVGCVILYFTCGPSALHFLPRITVSQRTWAGGSLSQGVWQRLSFSSSGNAVSCVHSWLDSEMESRQLVPLPSPASSALVSLSLGSCQPLQMLPLPKPKVTAWERV